MDLVPYIYHERQDQRSMLCAQHALNNLMQSPIWTATDLAEIAHKLDLIENSHLDAETRTEHEGRSANFDDSGFFSVQVIDEALHHFGLRLARWKSDEMKSMHAYPENQEAFILNHDLHWFTLRRFGGNADRWYNLNSITDKPPTWIGAGFLSMTISQAESEGYSIFAVVPVKPSSDPTAPKPGSLLICEADDRAQSLNPLLYTPPAGSSSGSSATNRRRREEEYDDEQPAQQRPRVGEDRALDNLSEDEQLRLAIEASLMCDRETSIVPGEGQEAEDDDDEQGLETFDSGLKGKLTTITQSPLRPTLNFSPDFESQMEAAIRASLEESSDGRSEPTPSADNFKLPIGDNWDEPTAEELRLRRLARFA